MNGKTYKFVSSENLSFTIGKSTFNTEANKPYIFESTEDASIFTFAKYGVLDSLIVSEIITVKNTILIDNKTVTGIEKIINGQSAIFNRERIEIGTAINNNSSLNLPIEGSGTNGAFIEVEEGDEFTITANSYSEVYRPYAFIDETYKVIEGAYAIGTLENKTIVAPTKAKYLAINNVSSIFNFEPKNTGIKPDIEGIKENLKTNNEKLENHEQLLYIKQYAYNEKIEKAGGSVRINVTLLKGQSYTLLSSEGMANFTLGESGVGENLGTIQANTETIITPKENVSLIYFERYGSIDIKIYQTFNIQEQIEQVNSYISLKTKYPSFSILSDSYSTYKDYLTPETNDTYYPAGDVDSVEKTWWGLLVKEQGMMLMQNNSYSGTYVCNSEKANETLQQNSFIRRMSNLARASVIFIFGATNDSWNNVDLGEYKYSDWTEEELKSFRPAFAFMLDYIKKKHFGSKIVVIKNPPVSDGTGFTQDISDSIDEICLHYSIDTLSPSISKASNWHPNEYGMISVYESIIDYLSAH